MVNEIKFTIELSTNLSNYTRCQTNYLIYSHVTQVLSKQITMIHTITYFSFPFLDIKPSHHIYLHVGLIIFCYVEYLIRHNILLHAQCPPYLQCFMLYFMPIYCLNGLFSSFCGLIIDKPVA